MAYTEMSLPQDIPWKRMGVSPYMIDTTAGDLRFPHKWESSVAVFYHEPEDIPPDYCNRRIIYLKIVCTLTNFQFGSDEITVLDRLLEGGHTDLDWGIAFRTFYNLTDSYPCYGALVQVGVYPDPDEGVARQDFPYIQSAEPRKREMYEAVSLSGEQASQSATKLNVNKGSTSTDSTEDYDVRTSRGNKGVALGLLGEWGGREVTGQWGTVGRHEDVEQRVTSTDASREHRESHAFSTNINQLYTLLNNFHLGTNRTVFFLEPRPHIQDAKFSFIRGLRRLEGVQEFFLVVNSPVSMSGLCVEVALETAHADLERTYYPRVIPLADFYSDPTNLSKTDDALGFDVAGTPWAYWEQAVQVWNGLNPYMRLAIQNGLKDGTGVPGLYNYLGPTAYVQVLWVASNVPEAGIGQVRLIFEEVQTDSGAFFVVGHCLHACETLREREEVASGLAAASSREAEYSERRSTEGTTGTRSGEALRTDGLDTRKDTTDADRARSGTAARAQSARNPGGAEMSKAKHLSMLAPKPSVVFERNHLGEGAIVSGPAFVKIQASHLNGLVREINRSLISSVGSADRIEYGKLEILDTDLVANRLCQVLRHLSKAGVKDRAIDSLEGVRERRKEWLDMVGDRSSLFALKDLDEAHSVRRLSASEKKTRREILIGALKALDRTTADRKATRQNPIAERVNLRIRKSLGRDVSTLFTMDTKNSVSYSPTSFFGKLTQLGRYFFPKKG
jgi:hypothetical protein